MTQSNECQETSVLTHRCEEAVEAINAVMNTPARDRHQIVDFGECAIVRLRDCLIKNYRAAQEPGQRQQFRAALDQVNTALSLITGVEYPGAGIQEKPMQQAREILKELKL